jgi:hypothetical protein
MEEELDTSNTRYKPEQIVTLLRQIEEGTGTGNGRNPAKIQDHGATYGGGQDVNP